MRIDPNQWLKLESLFPGQTSVVNTPLINPEKHLPLPHNQCGLKKNFIQAVDRNGAGLCI